MMPPLEALMVLYSKHLPFKWVYGFRNSQPPSRQTADSFPVTHLKAHQSYSKMQGSHPSTVCLSALWSFELGDRRCLCDLSHAWVCIQNMTGLKIQEEEVRSVDHRRFISCHATASLSITSPKCPLLYEQMCIPFAWQSAHYVVHSVLGL